MVNSVLRPFPNDPGRSLKFPAMFENWIIILLLIVILFHRQKIDNHRKAIIISLSIFATTILLIIGWTIPIIGAIYRYRLPAQIAILLIIAILFKPIHLISKKSDSK